MQILNLIEFQSTGPVSLILTVVQYPFTGGGGIRGYTPGSGGYFGGRYASYRNTLFSILGYIFNGVDGNATACLVKTIAAQRSTLTKLTERTKGNGRGVSNTNQ